MAGHQVGAYLEGMSLSGALLNSFIPRVVYKTGFAISDGQDFGGSLEPRLLPLVLGGLLAAVAMVDQGMGTRQSTAPAPSHGGLELVQFVRGGNCQFSCRRLPGRAACPLPSNGVSTRADLFHPA